MEEPLVVALVLVIETGSMMNLITAGRLINLRRH